ncbi:MAG: hypothetical protein JWR10_684 [Rubritepida sp.]|nr:hypothetical protein [Rubritepida sp.]
MLDFSVARALGLMARTMPFLVLRLLVYSGIALAYVLLTSIGAGLGWLIGAAGSDEFQDWAAVFGGIFGFGLTAAILYFLQEYVLYIVKAGHIAVMIELMEGRPLPQGRSQIEHASAVVRQRFAESNGLFALDQFIKGVLGVVMGLVQGIATFLPTPGLQPLLSLFRAFLRVSIGFMDEVILGYSIRSKTTNAWDSARTGLVLYAQNSGPMLRNGAFLTVFVYGLSFVLFLFMLAPAMAIAYETPGGWSAGGIVFALLFAWAVKAAVIEPFAVACMMQAYFKVTAGQAPDPNWDARLATASGKFQELKSKAAGWGTRATV